MEPIVDERLKARFDQAIQSLPMEVPDDQPVLPSSAILSQCRKSLAKELPEAGIGLEETLTHLQSDVVPGLNLNSLSSRYFGFVTGGVTPAALVADRIVSTYDQNVGVHLPEETVATNIEDRALRMLCQLLQLDPAQFEHRIFTTGATASNLIGLILGREYVVSGGADDGLLGAAASQGITRVKILTTVPHSSLVKSAAVAGIGHKNVIDVSRADAPHLFDFDKLESIMTSTPHTGFIVSVSCSEVNSGAFATRGLADLQRLRALCDAHHGWLHVDGAFGLFARLLPPTAYPTLAAGAAGIELADSITADGHKLLNVPYDCGFLLSRHLDLATAVFGNPNAAYLAAPPAAAAADDDADAFVPSPLNIGLENSRRFRALPAYASLLAYGRAGHVDMLERQIALARRLAAWVRAHPAFELLPAERAADAPLDGVFMIVLFRARDEVLNRELKARINASGKMYVSPTQWDGQAAVRVAVSNWRVQPEKDFAVVKEVLEGIAGAAA